MTLKCTINVLFGIAVLLIFMAAKLDRSGPSGGYSNAPNEGNCTSCHTGTLQTSGNDWSNIRLNGNFKNGGYLLDSVYTIEITFKKSGVSRFGFQVTCLESATNNPAGTFTTSNNRVWKTSATISGKLRTYVEQSYTGSSSVATDSTRWVFTWKAPSTNVGKVKFYLCVNATDADNNYTNDIIYAKTFEYIYAGGLPEASANTTDPVTCAGYTVHFQGSGTNSPTSYSWKFPGGTPATSTAQNPTATFTGSGTRYGILTVKNSAGTSQPDTVSVTVNKSPTSAINGSAAVTLCQGDTIALTAVPYTGATYTWQPSGKTGTSLNVTDSGSYTVVTKITSNGCMTTSAPVKVSAAPKPTVSIGHNKKSTAFCDIISDTLTATSALADSFYWYRNSQFLIADKPAILPLSSNSPAAYQVRAKSAAGCLSPISGNISYSITPSLRVSNLHSTAISTSTVSLAWTPPAGHQGMMYSADSGKTWNNTVNDSSQLIGNLQPNTPYRLLIKVLQPAPCGEYINSINITTSPCSNLSFKLNMDTAICAGEKLHLTVGDLYDEHYSVSVNNGTYGPDTLFDFSPFASGQVLVRIIDSNSLGCPPVTRSLAYAVHDLPVQGFTYTRNGGKYTFTPLDMDGKTYVWEFENGDTSMMREPMYDYSSKSGQSVSVKLHVSNAYHCSVSDTQTIAIPDLSSVAELLESNIKVWPNPFNGNLYIGNTSGLTAEYMLTDLTGRTVFVLSDEEAGNELPVSGLTSGMYMLRVTAGGHSKMLRLIKE